MSGAFSSEAFSTDAFSSDAFDFGDDVVVVVDQPSGGGLRLRVDDPKRKMKPEIMVRIVVEILRRYYL